VVLLLADAMRSDHLGCYGYARNTSPNIDRLAAEGVLFENAYSKAPKTKESTATLVTSLSPSVLGMGRINDSLPESALLLMEEMRKGGYRTAVLSANPLVSPLFGFDRGVDFFYYKTPVITRMTGLGKAAGRIIRQVPNTGWVLRFLKAVAGILPHSVGRAGYAGESSDVMHDALLPWIDEDAGTPFFAYVHYMETHTPYVPRAPYDTMFTPADVAKPLHEFPKYRTGFLPFYTAPPLPASDLQGLIGQYDGAIADLDNEIGVLMRELRSRGLANRTLVVVTADHGDEFYDHQAWGHGHSLHEELIRVPLIFYLPGSLAGGTRSQAVVSLIDLMPTLLGAAGLPVADSEELEGKNLWPAIEAGRDPEGETDLFVECLSGSNYAAALRTGNEKLIFVSYDAREAMTLFDLVSDPHEQHDLSEEQPERTNALASELIARRQALIAQRKQGGRRTLDETTEESLRALGYIN
jgi:arylsulfatase A-like enzyme